MNYETDTDFKLNMSLAKALGFDIFNDQCASLKSKPSSVLIDCHGEQGDVEGSIFICKEVNYLTDPSVTWPLMIKHGIELSPCYNGLWFAGVVESYTNEEEVLSYSGITVCEDPLRAIVICLIKTLESKK